MAVVRLAYDGISWGVIGRERNAITTKTFDARCDRGRYGRNAARTGRGRIVERRERFRRGRRRVAVPSQIKAFCIDFNWWNGKFAPPGHWAEAWPEEHVTWYHDLSANVIQTFAVSCNGYAWYKGGRVPAQPGLRHNFLPEAVELAHRRGMLATGYFCVGANSKWGADHPELSYGTPLTMHIPFTDLYLDYLTASIADAIANTCSSMQSMDLGECPRISIDNLLEDGNALWKENAGCRFGRLPALSLTRTSLERFSHVSPPSPWRR